MDFLNVAQNNSKEYYAVDEANTHLNSGLIRVDGLHKDSRKVTFRCKDGWNVIFWHVQECCEDVWVEDADSFDSCIDIYTNASFCKIEKSSHKASVNDPICESGTWTFYRVTTDKGYDTIRWLGTSNGYYSEEVDIICINTKSMMEITSGITTLNEAIKRIKSYDDNNFPAFCVFNGHKITTEMTEEEIRREVYEEIV